MANIDYFNILVVNKSVVEKVNQYTYIQSIYRKLINQTKPLINRSCFFIYLRHFLIFTLSKAKCNFVHFKS